VPKEKPRVNIGEVIKTYRSQRGLSQGDIERRTGLLRCYLSRVENGHTVPSLETLAKIRFLAEIKRFSTTLSEGDKRLVLAMIRKMASLIPPPTSKKVIVRRAATV
jgi:transcriptional regulator with XRE-family HTH domain